MKVLQIILAIIWLAITVMALLDDGTLSFRLPFLCTSFALAAVMICEYMDGRGERR